MKVWFALLVSLANLAIAPVGQATEVNTKREILRSQSAVLTQSSPSKFSLFSPHSPLQSLSSKRLPSNQSLTHLAPTESRSLNSPSSPIVVAQVDPSPRTAQLEALPQISSPQLTTGQVIPSELLLFPSLIVIVVILILIAAFAYTRVYTITPSNEAFVKTGGIFRKQKKVILNGGCVVLPGFHELTRVPLREISIDVTRAGNLAVRTQDYLRANMRATFYVCISASDQNVLVASARLSNQGRITGADIKNALEKRADDAIRAAAKTKRLAEIDSDKLGFAQEVLNLIEPDLRKVGLTLNNIAISEIEESDTYDTNNFFDAQGVRLRTQTIQQSIQQKREVELATHVKIQQRELEAEQETLRIQQEKESAKLSQQLEVEGMRALRAREIQEAQDREAAATQRNKILLDQAVEEEQIAKDLQVQQKQLQSDIELQEEQKNLKVSQALQQQEAETAEITRKQSVDAARLRAQVEVAEAERQSRIAQQEAAIAIAEKEQERLQAEADRAKAEEAVATAAAVEQAQRSQQLAEIAAQTDAEKQAISDRNVVELDVFRRRRQAEIARQAAELEAESIRTLADAERDRLLAEAEGKQALIEAENALSDANRVAQIVSDIWPELVTKLPEIANALAPQPGVLGDARIYTFPGAGGGGNGGAAPDVNKLLLSASGLTLINSLFEEGKLGGILSQVQQMLTDAPTESSSSLETSSSGASSSGVTTDNDANESWDDFPIIDDTEA